MAKYVFEALSIVIGACLFAINYLIILPASPAVVPFVNIVAALIIIGPPMYGFYAKYRRKGELESQFMAFVDDLVDSVNSGMTLPVALENCAKRNYLSLGPFVNDLASQVNWGVPFEKALLTFAKRTGVPVIQRAITTIIETYKVGGKVADTLDSVGKSLMTIERINKERSLSVHSQTITMYLIYFVFIFILVVLQVFLIPALMPTTSEVVSIGAVPADMPQLYTQSFVYFIIIQGFFAGLATGKMSQGTVLAGLKHSMVLIIVGYAIFSFFASFPIKIF
jgi:flagellar protein FlaJ